MSHTFPKILKFSFYIYIFNPLEIDVFLIWCEAKIKLHFVILHMDNCTKCQSYLSAIPFPTYIKFPCMPGLFWESLLYSESTDLLHTNITVSSLQYLFNKTCWHLIRQMSTTHVLSEYLKYSLTLYVSIHFRLSSISLKHPVEMFIRTWLWLYILLVVKLKSIW